jgi:hypothetical protein
MFSLKGKLAFCITALLFILLVTSCVPSSGASSQGIYPVSATFSDFYRQFGGEAVLGPGISPLFVKDGVSYQYVVSALMAYDPNMVPLKRYRLSPIASSEWQINDLAQPVPGGKDQYYVNGHQIWEEIRSFYDQYGADILGLPLTSVMVNEVKQRYEQYFDGIGFYRNFTDPVGKIHLMPYGAWMCGNNCQYQTSDTNLPLASYLRQYSATEQLFLQESERLGYWFTGTPLLSPRLGSDGNYQMVFQNVVMYIDPLDGSHIKLRPLPSWLGIHSDKPVKQETADWLSFFPLQEGLGFNVPDIFTEYINNHGTMSISGSPITEYSDLEEGGYSQCFTNVCLEYHPNAPQELQVRPHMLGADYLASKSKASTPAPDFSSAMQINAWENHPLIPSGYKQVINIQASQNNIPMSGVDFSLVVKKPDGIIITYTLDPTGEDGKTSIELDPINGANGAIVQYEVCVIGPVSPQVCFSRSYTIWEQ